MEFYQIRMAYNDVRDGRKSYDDVLAMYEDMPDKTAAYEGGDTLLHAAAAGAHPAAVRRLLEQGADPDAVNEAGRTPLWAAAMRRELTPSLPKNAMYETAAALLEAGASPVKKDADGNLCYLAAAKNGNGEFIAALHEHGARLTRTDDSGNNGLHLLIESLYNPINDYNQAKKRYDKNAEENARGDILERDKRLTEEYRAMMEYRLAMAFRGAKALLEAGVDPEDKNNMGETAHILAERRGAKKIGALLRGEITGEENADDGDAARREATGGMTLMQAVGKKDSEAVRALVALGADVNQADDLYGYGEGTPLAMACFSCDYPMAELLLELGADPNRKTGDGRTALSWLRMPRGGVQKVFDEKWASRLIDAMVTAGLNIDAPVDDRSHSLLAWALLDNSDLEVFVEKETLRWCIVDSALRHGADVNRSNLYGQTPLMLASAGNPAYTMRLADDIQCLLLEKGADICARDREGNTALHYAAANENAAAARTMTENLLDYGEQDLNAVNNAGKTALDYATEQNNDMLVKLLLKSM